MNIAQACCTVHQWRMLLSPGASVQSTPGNLVVAVAELKRILEQERGDGQSIRELEITEAHLMTRQGVRWVMPFVLSAEVLQRPRVRATAPQTSSGS